jgi:hypothetical protein
MLMLIKQPLRFCAALWLSAILMLYACSDQAHGYAVSTTSGGAEIHWSSPNAGFYINTSGFPAGSMQALQGAMQTWTDVAASSFSFMYLGASASTAYGSNDGMNLICYGTLNGAQYADTLALNTFWYTSQGQLLDSDIMFNKNFSWATNGSALSYDIQSIALHELGHALSLDDLYETGLESMAMYYRFSKGQIKHSLQQDDMNGITYLYGGGSGATTTTTVPSTTTTTITSSSCPAETVLGHDSPDLADLRAFRDGFLSRSAAGRRIIHIYYHNADSIHAALDRNPAMQAAARKFFKTLAVLVRKND